MGGDGYNSMISNYSINTSGSYTIVARGYSSNPQGSYSLSLSMSAPPSPSTPPPDTLRGVIPLEPESGGWSIDDRVLQTGDIIVSTTESDWGSIGIRTVTQSPVSHTMIYIEDGMVIEAITTGGTRIFDLESMCLFDGEVVFRPLSEAIGGATLAVAFRYPNITPQQQLLIGDYAASQIGAYYKLEDHLLRITDGSYVAGPYQEELQMNYLAYEDVTFFCSELVIASYLAAGIPLTRDHPTRINPGEIAQLGIDQVLEYLGHLKYIP